MLALLNTGCRRLFDDWLERRLPRTERAILDRKSIFTFPSRAGQFFLVLLALLWLLAINYENNVVFAFGALLGAILIVSIFHGYGNLSGLELRVLAVESGFPGDDLRVDIEISHNGKRDRDDIWLSFATSPPQQIALRRDDQRTVVSLYLRARTRGRLQPGRLTVETVYPLGLVRVWTHVLLGGWGVVYPRLIAGQPLAVVADGEGDSAQEEISGSEDFAGLNPYRQGESYTHIAWKHFARGQGLYSKHFVDPVADPQWLEWDHFPGLDREARLSRLCSAVLEAEAVRSAYGLKLPGEMSPLGQGEAHRDKLLRMLALFECEDG